MQGLRVYWIPRRLHRVGWLCWILTFAVHGGCGSGSSGHKPPTRSESGCFYCLFSGSEDLAPNLSQIQTEFPFCSIYNVNDINTLVCLMLCWNFLFNVQQSKMESHLGIDFLLSFFCVHLLLGPMWEKNFKRKEVFLGIQFKAIWGHQTETPLYTTQDFVPQSKQARAKGKCISTQWLMVRATRANWAQVSTCQWLAILRGETADR